AVESDSAVAARNAIVHFFILSSNELGGRISAATGQLSARKRPSTLKSSSMSGQWMPCPAAAGSHTDRLSGEAAARRGNQARGALILRPSRSTTIRDVSLT